MGLNEKSMKIFGGFGRISYICNGNELLDKRRDSNLHQFEWWQFDLKNLKINKARNTSRLLFVISWKK
jgi:hypothetical protein